MSGQDLLPAPGVAEPGRDTSVPDARRRLRRLPDQGMVGGVCAGIAAYLAVEPLLVRVTFLVVALATGIGVALYPLAWALIPPAAPATPGLRRSWPRRLAGWRDAIGIALLCGIALLGLRRAGFWLGDEVVVPLVLASCGLGLILREATQGGRPEADGPVWRRWPGSLIGLVLVLSAAIVYLNESGTFAHSHHGVGGFVVVVVAFALVFGPWLLRLGRSLASERSERIRSQERADVAAHLHDSVLQTLALIQRRADDPREVAGLARRQERELRRWLFERGRESGAATLDSALEQAAAEIEQLYKVRVETVTVGDRALDERHLALVSAAREALTNAAKFAGEEQIDLFAEVTPERAQVFIRDRGVGFDPAAIPEDRHGVRHSIRERMRQHGGRAEIRSEPGGGTEVELTIEGASR